MTQLDLAPLRPNFRPRWSGADASRVQFLVDGVSLGPDTTTLTPAIVWDSRTVADTTLSREFELAAGMGLTDDELRRCNETAYAARFGD